VNKGVLIIIGITSFTPFFAQADEARSARNFASVAEALVDHDESIAEALSEVAATVSEVESLTKQITSKRQEAQRLQQEAQEAMAQANMLNNLSSNQGAVGRGAGNSGGGNGSKGLQLKTPELPEISEAAAFEMPSTPDAVDVGELASSLSFNSRGAANPLRDNPVQPFSGLNLPPNTSAKSPKLLSPGTVAAGNLPQLSGNTASGTPIGTSPNGGASTPGAGGTGGGGGMQGGVGTGNLGTSGAATGGDVMRSVGAEPRYSAGGLRIQTQQVGESGGEGDSAAAQSQGSGPDATAVKAQLSRSASGTSSNEERLNPEGRGLMAYIGFIQKSCRDAEKKLEVCEGPLPSTEESKVVAPTRTIASPPSQEVYGPVRAGLLGLVSGM
jgi:hypothetical protein